MISIDLSGKVALVTGGGQGLGAVIARRLAEAGASIVVNYFNDSEGVNKTRAEELADEIGNASMAFEADVRKAKAVEAMFDNVIEQYGKIDIVVNNAGIIRDKTIKKMSEAEWQDVIDTNLTGTFHVCREAALKCASEGRIISVSSISGVLGFFGQANYAASKAGVIGLTRSLSREVARRNITANAVAPGVVLTEMGLSIPEEVRQGMITQIPLGRFGEPEEIANVVLFLSSPLSSYVTGQVININGGWVG